MALGDKQVITGDCARCMLRREHGQKLIDPPKELMAMQAVQAVHHLAFRSTDDLKRHLMQVMGGDSIRVEPHLKFFNFIHRYYSDIAREKFAPICLVWMEANGKTVHRRAEWIMNYRGKHPQRHPEVKELVDNPPF